MSIRFPDFRDTQCMSIGACGSLDTGEKEVLDSIEKPKGEELIASYRSGKTTVFIRVLLGGSSQKHVHIDLAKKEAFGGKLPKLTHKRKDVEKTLEQFVGKKISTEAYGGFLLPVADLPEGGLIRSTFFETEQGDLSIRASGVDFAIKGAPIRSLAWQSAEKGKSIRVKVTAIVDTVIGRDYLLEQLRLLDSGFRLFVLGGSADDGN